MRERATRYEEIAALMLEALQADADGHEHYVPFVSGITPYISQLILAAKRCGPGDGSRGAKKAEVPKCLPSSRAS